MWGQSAATKPPSFRRMHCLSGFKSSQVPRVNTRPAAPSILACHREHPARPETLQHQDRFCVVGPALHLSVDLCQEQTRQNLGASEYEYVCEIERPSNLVQ